MKKRLIYTNQSYDYIAQYGNGSYDEGIKNLYEEIFGEPYCEADPKMRESAVEDAVDGRIYDDARELMDCDWLANNGECLILGAVGTWTGYHKITPVMYKTVGDALEICLFPNCPCRIEVYKVGKHLEIRQVHHDGVNNVRIRLLNERGVKAYERKYNNFGNANLENEIYHKGMEYTW